MFAQSIVEDYNLPSSSQIAITKAIQEQLSDFKAHMPDVLGDDEDDVRTVEQGRGELMEDDTVWWERWRKRLRNENGSIRKKRRKLGSSSSPVFEDSREVERTLPVANSPDSDETSMDDLRILIKVRCTRAFPTKTRVDCWFVYSWILSLVR
jgi:SWI/SNF-related matrix-associated actin-dependent regulator of chromatin subfamily B protein 1